MTKAESSALVVMSIPDLSSMLLSSFSVRGNAAPSVSVLAEARTAGPRISPVAAGAHGAVLAAGLLLLAFHESHSSVRTVRSVQRFLPRSPCSNGRAACTGEISERAPGVRGKGPDAPEERAAGGRIPALRRGLRPVRKRNAGGGAPLPTSGDAGRWRPGARREGPGFRDRNLRIP
ncbi:hypothetical protein MTP06_34810 [Streptomyces sp. PLM4]|nr:hypothetical protein MTP06_34810 [Streptomyces sp. PLM4]